jgi:uncharacterized membrane protein
MATVDTAPQSSADALVEGIRIERQWWILLALGIMVAAIQSHSLWFLNFVHVFSGLLWTGTDIFMGFILGPILRRVDVPTRRAITLRLMPRMLFYMPTMSILTSTSGWYLAEQSGFLNMPFPNRWWLIAAFVLTAILTIQGLGILLPTNLRVYLEMRKPQPDGARIQRWMDRYVKVVALQGVMQVATILVMARLATGA